jgi:hypothetical protein
MTVKLLGNTRWIERPKWQGAGFLDPEAATFWSELPDNLRRLALTEIESGNVASQILRNDERGIVLLEFERGPLTELPKDIQVAVHTAHELGNYCYDGTKCTYEDLSSGCFLAFCDPDYKEPSN